MTHVPWNFPDLPASLAGLTLEHVSKLQTMILDHGMYVGDAKLGKVHTLTVREPAPMNLMLIGPPELSDLLVLDRDAPEAGSFHVVLFPGTAIGGRLVWNVRITLEDVLSVLDTDGVIKTSQLAASAKDGAN